MRLDAELVRRGLARSRGRATELIADGRVHVVGTVARKPSHPVTADTELAVSAEHDWVSRGGHKLAGALADLAALGTPMDVRGAECLDAGASTGGFTEVLLDAGAGHVLALDVGHGQMAASLVRDPRVTLVEGINVRDLGPLDPQPSIVVADLSFISLEIALKPLVEVAAPGAEFLILVKPQFEVGRQALGSRGVVEDPAQRRDAVLTVARAVPDPAEVRAVLPSRLPGPAGNHEYFLHLVHRADTHRRVDLTGELEAAVARAIDGRASLVRSPSNVPRRLA